MITRVTHILELITVALFALLTITVSAQPVNAMSTGTTYNVGELYTGTLQTNLKVTFEDRLTFIAATTTTRVTVQFYSDSGQAMKPVIFDVAATQSHTLKVSDYVGTDHPASAVVTTDHQLAELSRRIDRQNVGGELGTYSDTVNPGRTVQSARFIEQYHGQYVQEYLAVTNTSTSPTTVAISFDKGPAHQETIAAVTRATFNVRTLDASAQSSIQSTTVAGITANLLVSRVYYYGDQGIGSAKPQMTITEATGATGARSDNFAQQVTLATQAKLNSPTLQAQALSTVVAASNFVSSDGVTASDPSAARAKAGVSRAMPFENLPAPYLIFSQPWVKDRLSSLQPVVAEMTSQPIMKGRTGVMFSWFVAAFILALLFLLTRKISRAAESVVQDNKLFDSKSIKAYVTEAVGTGALVFWIIAANGRLAPVIAGVTLLVLVSIFGDISGAHVNPAVTLGLMAKKQIRVARGALYWVAQFAGGSVASVLAFSFVPVTARYGPPVGVYELAGVFFLLLAVYYVSTGYVAKAGSGLTVGGALFVGLWATGGYLNPVVATMLGYGGALATWMTLFGGVLAGLVGGFLKPDEAPAKDADDADPTKNIQVFAIVKP